MVDDSVRARGGGEEAPPRRDYRPTKWLTNSAMDIWYGNKTFIDIMWREFSDFMSKITEREDRSITLETLESNEIHENTTQLFNDEIVRVDVRLKSNSTRLPIGDGHEEVQPRRDYRPTKWITNSAMDIWYGNRTFIDIVWREFSDFMFKITERADRSITLGEYRSNEIQENRTGTNLLSDDIVRVDNIDGVHLKEKVVEKKDYTPSKWVAKSAMDVWYGNRSMIEVISNELADLMYKLTARPVRSTHMDDIELHRTEDRRDSDLQDIRMEVRFRNQKNETLHTVTF
ncbi:unnamed protein product [Arctia plantaginis]|uniref:Uncharacterized protein n=1 Tax=Arctia plantaginis TaxID=874455 RepID=A0A8S0Z727_ARCPL|nr:unnamed protein product [Arctia plantaginis]